MSKSPKVTVLMPVFNGERYIKEAIDSILHQSFADFELLVIDDGSTDAGPEIVELIKDQRIRLCRSEKNQGVPAALNIGLDLAHGQYIARMDSDDISLPERLAKQVEFMEANSEFGLCGTNALSINAEGEIITPPWWHETPVPLEWTLFWENPVAHSTVMVRAGILKSFKLKYRLLPAEDGDLWSRLVLKARIARLPEVFLHYRYRPESAFNARRNEHIRQAIESSRELARAVTGQEAPRFHRYLTIYPQAMGERPKPDKRTAVEKWINVLLKKSGEFWGWDKTRFAYASKDGRMRLQRYFSHI